MAGDLLISTSTWTHHRLPDHCALCFAQSWSLSSHGWWNCCWLPLPLLPLSWEEFLVGRQWNKTLSRALPSLILITSLFCNVKACVLALAELLMNFFEMQMIRSSLLQRNQNGCWTQYQCDLSVCWCFRHWSTPQLMSQSLWILKLHLFDFEALLVLFIAVWL